MKLKDLYKPWAIVSLSSLLATLSALCLYVPAVRTVALAGVSLCLSALGHHFWRKHREDTAVGRMKMRCAQTLAQLRRRAGREALRAPWYVVMGPSQSGKSSLIDGADLLVHAEATPHPAPEPHARMLATSDGVFVDAPGRLMHPGHHREWRALMTQLVRRLGKKRMGGLVLTVRVDDVRTPELYVESLRGALAAALGAIGRQVPVTLVLTQADSLPGFAATFARADNLREGPWGFSLADNDEIALSCNNRMTALVETLRRYAIGQLGEDDISEQRALLYMFPQTLGALTRPLQQFVERVFGARAQPDELRLAGVYLCASPPSRSDDQDALHSALAPQNFASDAKWLVDWQSMAPKELPETAVAAKRQAQPSSLELAQSTLGALMPTELTSPQTLGTRTSPRDPSGHGMAARGLGAATSYFVRGLFSRVLGHHAPLNGPLSRKGLYGLWTVARPQCFVAMLLLLVAGLAAQSFYLNASWLNHAQRTIAPLVAQPTQVDFEAVLPTLGHLAEEIERHSREGAPLKRRLGLYRSSRLTVPLAELYLALCDALIVGEQKQSFAREAAQSWQHFGLTPEPLAPLHSSALLTELHAHLLWTAPKEPHEPTLASDGEAAWLSETLLAQVVQRTDDAELRRELAVHIERYVALLARLPELLAKRQTQHVAEARALLARRPLAERLVDGIVQDAARLGEPIGVEQLVAAGRLPLRGKERVQRAFTREGYLEVARPALAALEQGGSAWIFEPLPASLAARQELVRDAKARYFGRYAAAWLQFLDGLSWRDVATVWSARQLLDHVVAAETPPLTLLLDAVAEHTELATLAQLGQGARVLPLMQRLLGRAPKDVAGAPAAALRIETAGHVEAAFLPVRRWLGRGREQPAGGQAPPMALYQEQLLGLKQAVTAYMDDPAAAQSLDEPLRQVRLNAAGLIDTIPAGAGLRPRLSALLLGPIEQVTRALARGVRSRSDGSWGPEVAQSARVLLRQYPFYAGGADASVAEVFNFFRPGSGTLWSYYRRELAQDLVRQGSQFVFDERMGGVVRHAYRPDVLRYFAQAQTVTNALFPSGEGSEPTLDVEVRLVTTAEVEDAELRYDGHTLSVQRGSASSGWQRWQWPPKDAAQGATYLAARGKRVSSAQWQHDGVWGLWRLFESGRAHIERSHNTLTVYWPVGGHQSALGLEVRPLRREHPLFEASGSAGLFGSLRNKRLWPPGRLTPGDAAQAQLGAGAAATSG